MHTFVVSGDAPFRTLQITVPAGFEEFTAEVGEPVVGDTPPDTPPDLGAPVQAAARHQIEILGPPPTRANVEHRASSDELRTVDS
ncbi:hypothetical protein BH11ACT1_BH11ACT1_30790 [soil metagenome]